MALRGQGWHVSGEEATEDRMAAALAIGAVDAVGWDAEAEVSFVATPVGQLPEMVVAALAVAPGGVVSDVGGVKAPVVEAVGDPRFVGVPVERIISKEYAAERRKQIRKDAAWQDIPPPGDLGGGIEAPWTGAPRRAGNGGRRQSWATGGW